LEHSKAFYKKYLGLDVVADFGANVTLTGGIALQTLESWRSFIIGLDVNFKSRASELYFEEDDYDAFLTKIDGLELVHPPMEHSWGQRVVRFYDPDGHIIEVGEGMTTVSRRFAHEGMTVAEIAARMEVGEGYVKQWLKKDTAKNFGANELSATHAALASTLRKCEKIESAKLGKAQQTLLGRRVAALKVALALIEREISVLQQT